MLDLHEIVIRLGLALIFGAIVGVEREWRHKNAGIKTNTLVTIGSAAFALMSNTFGPLNHNPAQLAAAVVTGIGFIGAGVIIHRGASVQGVTTAATLWADAALGVALGFGYYLVGAITFVGIIITQFGLRRLEGAIGKRSLRVKEIELRVECEEELLPEVNRAWAAFASERNIVPLRQTMVRVGSGMLWRAVFITPPTNGLDLSGLEEALVPLPGVRKFDARQTSHQSEEL